MLIFLMVEPDRNGIHGLCKDKAPEVIGATYRDAFVYAKMTTPAYAGKKRSHLRRYRQKFQENLRTYFSGALFENAPSIPETSAWLENSEVYLGNIEKIIGSLNDATLGNAVIDGSRKYFINFDQPRRDPLGIRVCCEFSGICKEIRKHGKPDCC